MANPKRNLDFLEQDVLLAVSDHERELLDMFNNHFYRGFLDVGSQAGLWVRELGRNCEEIHAFEPFPETHAQLQRNVKEWQLGGKTKTHQKAVWNDEGFHDMTTYDRPSHSTLLAEHPMPADVPGFDSPCTTEVETVTLDSMLGDFMAKIDFMKIDTEGAEIAVLEGAEAFLSLHNPLLCVEVHNKADIGPLQDQLALCNVIWWGPAPYIIGHKHLLSEKLNG